MKYSAKEHTTEIVTPLIEKDSLQTLLKVCKVVCVRIYTITSCNAESTSPSIWCDDRTPKCDGFYDGCHGITVGHQLAMRLLR